MAAAQNEGKDKPATLAEQYQALAKEFHEAANVHFKATTDEERNQAVARVEKLPPRLLELADRASSDMREDGLLARTVTVKIRDADFTTRQAGRTLPEPVSSDRVIYALARELLHRLRRARRVPARLLGVALSQFVRAEGAAPQLSLLEAPRAAGVESERDRVLARVLDEVLERFGPDALARGRTPAE